MSRVDAAGAIRSLLEEFWGRLWECVRKPSEQEIKPDLMAARLAAGQSGGREELVIKANWHVYRDVQDGSGKRDGLHRKASNVFHRREGKFTVDLAEVWGETLDHINAVLLASTL